MLHETEKGIHIHQFGSINERLLSDFSFYILGSVMCPLHRVDLNENNIEQACEYIRGLQSSKKIYIQQPYYLLENSMQFIGLVKKLRKNGLIDGVMINSPGILRCFTNDDLEIIFSRFAIRKRKRTNKYLYDLLKDYDIKAVECFSNDKKLISDLKAFSKIELWLRENHGKFYTFSPKCLVKDYLNQCTNDSSQCISGAYTLKNLRENINFILAGHFMYTSNPGKVLDYGTNVDSIVYNEKGYEL